MLGSPCSDAVRVSKWSHVEKKYLVARWRPTSGVGRDDTFRDELEPRAAPVYRMLGSLQDVEGAAQDTLLRASKPPQELPLSAAADELRGS